jgi:hypothetical protein
MTVQELFQSALYKFGQDPGNIRFTDDFYSAINDAQNDIANNRRWGFLRSTDDLTTTADTRHVALPSDFSKPYEGRGNIRNTTEDGSVIELMTYEDWQNSYYEDGSDTGEPAYCYIQGDNIYFSPVPDDEYTISIIYYKTPTKIEDTNTSITVPDKYSELLKKMIWRRLQDAGYSAMQEIQISDTDINRLMVKCAQDDIAKYGGLNLNLNSTTYNRRTV